MSSSSASFAADTDHLRTFVHAASGAKIQMHAYGATLCRYQTPLAGESLSVHDHLFLSSLAILDESVPIRGGVPVVFPIFGPPKDTTTNTMPQHGFARRNVWSLVTATTTTTTTANSDDDDAAAKVVVYELIVPSKTLLHGVGTGNAWATEAATTTNALECRLELTVTFDATALTMRLRIQNTSTMSFNYQALLHTYYKVDGRAALDPQQCFVQGLQDYTCVDKVAKEGHEGGGNNSGKIVIAGEVDRVYVPPLTLASTNIVHVTIGVGNNRTVTLQASAAKQVMNVGTTEETPIPVSCVVWNPHVAKAEGMADFGNDEYHDMICVEPGILGEDQVLQSGEEAWLEQVIRVA